VRPDTTSRRTASLVLQITTSKPTALRALETLVKTLGAPTVSQVTTVPIVTLRVLLVLGWQLVTAQLTARAVTEYQELANAAASLVYLETHVMLVKLVISVVVMPVPIHRMTRVITLSAVMGLMRTVQSASAPNVCVRTFVLKLPSAVGMVLVTLLTSAIATPTLIYRLDALIATQACSGPAAGKFVLAALVVTLVLGLRMAHALLGTTRMGRAHVPVITLVQTAHKR